MELLHLAEAAHELGVSYPTLKQWIYRRRIRSVKTAGGHHRIPRAEIDRMLFQKAGRPGGREKPGRRDRAPRATGETRQGSGLEYLISGRNQLVGHVRSIEVVGLLAKVTLDIGGQKVTSIITRDACRELGLKAGDMAAALIKATEVMIIRPVRRKGAKS